MARHGTRRLQRTVQSSALLAPFQNLSAQQKRSSTANDSLTEQKIFREVFEKKVRDTTSVSVSCAPGSARSRDLYNGRSSAP